MGDIGSVMEEHIEQMAGVVQKLSLELRSGLKTPYENFMGFFHAIHWKEPWLMGLMGFHVLLLIISILSRKNINFQMCFFLFAYKPLPYNKLGMPQADYSALWHPQGEDPGSIPAPYTCMAGVYFAERLNSFLSNNWKSFATQNYFDPHGIFLSVLWSGPLLVIAIIILVNTLLSLSYMIVSWKKAELRHRARLSRNKQD